MSAEHYRVELALEGELVREWVSTGPRGTMPYAADISADGKLMRWRVDDVLAPNARQAARAGLDELEVGVPGMHTLLEQHDGNYAITVERLTAAALHGSRKP